jgi:hypothetical protein
MQQLPLAHVDPKIVSPEDVAFCRQVLRKAGFDPSANWQIDLDGTSSFVLFPPDRSLYIKIRNPAEDTPEDFVREVDNLVRVEGTLTAKTPTVLVAGDGFSVFSPLGQTFAQEDRISPPSEAKIIARAELVGRFMVELYTRHGLVHPDLRLRNITNEGEGKIGVIDWGHAAPGDPHLFFQHFMLYPEIKTALHAARVFEAQTGIKISPDRAADMAHDFAIRRLGGNERFLEQILRNRKRWKWALNDAAAAPREDRVLSMA